MVATNPRQPAAHLYWCTFCVPSGRMHAFVSHGWTPETATSCPAQSNACHVYDVLRGGRFVLSRSADMGPAARAPRRSPRTVAEAIEAARTPRRRYYRSTADVGALFADWVHDRCDLSDSSARTATTDLLASFNAWADEVGQERTNPVMFGRALSAVGLQAASVRVPGGRRVRGYSGIRLA
jgi:hypothetical protein